MPTVCRCLRARACECVGFLGRGGTAVPPPAPPRGSCFHRVSATPPPARPPFLLPPSLACWLCGHPHPAAKRRGPARASRDPRAAPGPVRVSPAISFSDEEPVALERFALARRGALGHVGGAGLRTQRRWTPPVVGIPGQGGRRAGLSLGQLGRLVWGRDPGDVLLANGWQDTGYLDGCPQPETQEPRSSALRAEAGAGGGGR